MHRELNEFAADILRKHPEAVKQDHVESLSTELTSLVLDVHRAVLGDALLSELQAIPVTDGASARRHIRTRVAVLTAEKKERGDVPRS